MKEDIEYTIKIYDPEDVDGRAFVELSNDTDMGTFSLSVDLDSANYYGIEPFSILLGRDFLHNIRREIGNILDMTV